MKWAYLKKWIDLPNKINAIDKKIYAIDKKIDTLEKDNKEVREALIKYGFIQPYMQTRSLKQITKRGLKLLQDNNVDSFLENHCELLKNEDLKRKTYVDIFIESSNWIKSNGKKKLVELKLNSPLNEEECAEILSLALMYKIKPNT